MFPLLFSCQSEKFAKLKSNVGDISFDEKQYDRNFKVCNSWVTQYFSLEKKFQYFGEKQAIEEKFNKEFFRNSSENRNLYPPCRNGGKLFALSLRLQGAKGRAHAQLSGKQ